MSFCDLLEEERKLHEKRLEEWAKIRNLDPVLTKLVMRLTGESIAYDIIHGPLHNDHEIEQLFHKRGIKRNVVGRIFHLY